MKAKFFITGARGCWRAGFKIGVQSFFVCERETKQEAIWFRKQLKTAFGNLEKGERETKKRK